MKSMIEKFAVCALNGFSSRGFRGGLTFDLDVYLLAQTLELSDFGSGLDWQLYKCF